MSEQQWEYQFKVHVIPLGASGFNESYSNEWFDSIGAEGWEAVSVNPAPPSMPRSELWEPWFVLFKRPKR